MVKKIFNKRTTNGYTIIETMIAVSLFIVITMSGMTALLNANALHQRSQNVRSVMDNLSFIIEDISKNIRTGYHIRCFSGNNNISTDTHMALPRSCPNGWGIAFESAYGSNSIDTDQWVYYISSSGQLYKSTQAPYDSSTFIQLTPDNVIMDFNASGFSVLGAEAPSAGDKQEPFVTIRLVGKITYKGVDIPFSLQTSASQRLIDV